MNIYEWIIIAILSVLFFNFVTRVAKRLSAHITLSKIGKACGAKINYTRLPILSMFKLSKKPDMTIEIGDDIYLARFINGRSSRTMLHFASPEYFVTYVQRSFLLGYRGFGGMRVSKDSMAIMTSRRKVKILPQLEIPRELLSDNEKENKKIHQILIFSPCPSEVTYVTNTKTSIKLAFTGDEFYGQKIFSAKTFISYADRMKREKEYQKATE